MSKLIQEEEDALMDPRITMSTVSNAERQRQHAEQKYNIGLEEIEWLMVAGGPLRRTLYIATFVDE